MAGIGAVHHDHTDIVAQLERNLSVTDIDGEYLGSPAFEHGVGEAAGACPNVRANRAVEFDLKY